jgi:hypothetical protein
LTKENNGGSAPSFPNSFFVFFSGGVTFLPQNLKKGIPLSSCLPG